MSMPGPPPVPFEEWPVGWQLRPYPVPFASVVGGFAVLFGFALSETTGSNRAELDLYSGTDSTGLKALPITLTAGQSTSDWYGPQGLWFRAGIFPVVVSGSMAGSLWIADMRDLPGS